MSRTRQVQYQRRSPLCARAFDVFTKQLQGSSDARAAASGETHCRRAQDLRRHPLFRLINSNEDCWHQLLLAVPNQDDMVIADLQELHDSGGNVIFGAVSLSTLTTLPGGVTTTTTLYMVLTQMVMLQPHAMSHLLPPTYQSTWVVDFSGY